MVKKQINKKKKKLSKQKQTHSGFQNDSKMLTKQNSDAYTEFTISISSLLEESRHQSARSINSILTATYWEIGRKIVEFDQYGKRRAQYGERLLKQLSKDLKAKFGRGFSVDNLERMRTFYLGYPHIVQTKVDSYDKSNQKSASLMRKLDPKATGEYLTALAQIFPLSWTHYVRLLSVKTVEARNFYETEAIRGGWSVRQLDRQISTLFYERTALSKNKAAMLTKGSQPRSEDIVTPNEEIKDPVVLEFLGLKDEYSETELEDALIQHLENFLLELGNNFTFMGRQKRIRIGDSWYRIDLLFYHRRLRNIVIIDLKVGKFKHADVGQMNLYINYVWEHLYQM